MTRFDHLSQRLAFATAAIDQHPDKLDAERIEDVALAIERMVPRQHEQLFYAAGLGLDALFQHVITVQHLVNDVRRDRVKKNGGQFFEAFLNPDDVLRGLRWFQVKQGLSKLDPKAKKELEEALGSNDVAATAQALDRFGFDSNKEPVEWIARVVSAFPKDGVVQIGASSGSLGVVSIRGKPAEQIPQLEKTLEKTLAALAKANDPADKDALRTRAADTFAALMNASLMLGKRERSSRPNLAAWFDRLAAVGAPGFLPSRQRYEHDVPLLGGKIVTEHRFSPEVQAVALKLQLGQRGNGLDYLRPDGSTVILVGNDEKHLGRPGAPLGVVVDGFAVVPSGIQAEMYIKTMGDFERKLGFGELPSGRFRIQTRALGPAIRLPLAVDVGGARFELREGNYVSGAKDAKVVPGVPIELSANGVTRRIDPRTGEVS